MRAYRLADAACRVFAPAALGSAGEKDWADRLRLLAPVVDKDSAYAAVAAYDAAAAVAAYAAANAAYDAAYAAYATAYVATADAAADAADAAAAAADAAQPTWDYAIRLLDELLPAATQPLVRSYADFEHAIA